MLCYLKVLTMLYHSPPQLSQPMSKKSFILIQEKPVIFEQAQIRNTGLSHVTLFWYSLN